MRIKFKERKGKENISYLSQIFIKSSPQASLGKYERERRRYRRSQEAPFLATRTYQGVFI